MIHDRQGLTFEFEAFQVPISEMSRTDDLDRDFTLHGRSLFSEPNRAHAAFAEFPAQPVRTDRADLEAFDFSRSFGRDSGHIGI